MELKSRLEKPFDINRTLNSVELMKGNHNVELTPRQAKSFDHNVKIKFRRAKQFDLNETMASVELE